MENYGTYGIIKAVFYVEEKDTVYIPVLCTEGTDASAAWVIAFSTDEPQDYRISGVQELTGNWLSTCVMVGEHIYLQGYGDRIPYEIDLDTLAFRECREEHYAARAAAQRAAAEAADISTDSDIFDFLPTIQYENVMIYSAYVRENEYELPAAIVYLAYEDKEPVVAMVLNTESGEAIMVDDFMEHGEMSAVADTVIPDTYSPYFREILQAGKNGGEYTDEIMQGAKSGLKYSYLKSAGEYKEAEPAYSAARDFYLEDGGVCQIDWLKLSDELVLENLTFDLSKELEEADLAHGIVYEMFYDREGNSVYLVVSSLADYGAGTANADEMTWVVSFAPEEPEKYTVYEYLYSSWFGNCYRIGDSIFLHGGAGDAPYEIDMKTQEGRICEGEYSAAKIAAQEFAQAYAEKNGIRPDVCWLFATAKYGDVTIFTGLVQEAMDIPELARVYVASRSGEILEAMVVNEETKEVTIAEDLSTIAAVEQLTQEELDWYNESFFNQAYLNENATPEKRIINQFLTHEYNCPGEINLTEIFYNGMGEELTPEDWECLSGEARWRRALYTSDMEVLSEEEHADVASLSQEFDVIRASKEGMESVLRQYTGQENPEIFDGKGMKSAWFNKKDMVFYWIHSDTNMVYVEVTKGYLNSDGSRTLFYKAASSPNWMEDAKEYMVILNQHNQFCLNRAVEESAPLRE